MRLLVSLVFLSMILFSAELNWSNDYNKTLLKAKKENKPVYILITSQSCKWCIRFENTTLQDKNIKKRLHSQFMTLHLSREKDYIPSKFKTAPVPRHYFVDSNGDILYMALGYRDVELFDSFMSNAQEKQKSNNTAK